MSIFYIRYGRHDMHGENARHQEKLNIVQGWMMELAQTSSFYLAVSCQHI